MRKTWCGSRERFTSSAFAEGQNLEVEVEVSMELENAFNWNFCINIV